jgi:hypothetical protein
LVRLIYPPEGATLIYEHADAEALSQDVEVLLAAAPPVDPEHRRTPAARQYRGLLRFREMVRYLDSHPGASVQGGLAS